MNKLPKARNENIVVQNLPQEVLIYDLATDRAFCLNETLHAVFIACDGKTTFEELKRRHHLTDDLIHFALDELRANDLLADSTGGDSYFGGLSRREVIKRVALTSMVAVPVISGLIAPRAAQAASSNVCSPVACTCSVGSEAPFPLPCSFLGGTSSGCNTQIANCDCIIPPLSDSGECGFGIGPA